LGGGGREKKEEAINQWDGRFPSFRQSGKGRRRNAPCSPMPFDEGGKGGKDIKSTIGRGIQTRPGHWPSSFDKKKEKKRKGRFARTSTSCKKGRRAPILAAERRSRKKEREAGRSQLPGARHRRRLHRYRRTDWVSNSPVRLHREGGGKERICRHPH